MFINLTNDVTNLISSNAVFHIIFVIHNMIKSQVSVRLKVLLQQLAMICARLSLIIKLLLPLIQIFVLFLYPFIKQRYYVCKIFYMNLEGFKYINVTSPVFQKNESAKYNQILSVLYISKYSWDQFFQKKVRNEKNNEILEFTV